MKPESGTVTLKGIESITAVFKSDEEFTLLDGSKIGILYAAWLHYKNLPPVEQPEIL